MRQAIVTLKKGEGRLLKSGGAWIFDNEIDSIMGEFENGDIVIVHDFDGYGMGRGFINNFTSAMVTAGAVIFLVTPGQKIAVFTLFDCINTGRYGEASMIATFIIAITISVNVLFSIIVAWKGKKKRVFRTEKHK